MGLTREAQVMEVILRFYDNVLRCKLVRWAVHQHLDYGLWSTRCFGGFSHNHVAKSYGVVLVLRWRLVIASHIHKIQHIQYL